MRNKNKWYVHRTSLNNKKISPLVDRSGKKKRTTPQTDAFFSSVQSISKWITKKKASSHEVDKLIQG